MNRLVVMPVLLGVVLTITPAIAQTEQVQPGSSLEDFETLSPTENAGSADLVTQPARSTSSTLVNVDDEAMSGTIQELRIEPPNVTLTEGPDFSDTGPANADHVQFVFE